MIRAYRPEDLERIMAIGNRAFQAITKNSEEQLGVDIAIAVQPDPEFYKGKQVKAFAENFPERVLICEREGTLVGFCTYIIHAEKSMGEIGNNAADPECNERGVGRELYEAAIEQFRKVGMQYATVTTGLEDCYIPARKSYERAGFTRCLKHIQYYLDL
mgnify:FL=1|jgi:ribosomal protein S18 acetylase RimI-like enzyme